MGFEHALLRYNHLTTSDAKNFKLKRIIFSNSLFWLPKLRTFCRLGSLQETSAFMVVARYANVDASIVTTTVVLQFWLMQNNVSFAEASVLCVGGPSANR